MSSRAVVAAARRTRDALPRQDQRSPPRHRSRRPAAQWRRWRCTPARVTGIEQRRAAVVVVVRPSLRECRAARKPGDVQACGRHRQSPVPDRRHRLRIGDGKAVPVDFLGRGEAQRTGAARQLRQRHAHLPRHAGGVAEFRQHHVPPAVTIPRFDRGRPVGRIGLPRREDGLGAWILDPPVDDEERRRAARLEGAVELKGHLRLGRASDEARVGRPGGRGYVVRGDDGARDILPDRVVALDGTRSRAKKRGSPVGTGPAIDLRSSSVICQPGGRS